MQNYHFNFYCQYFLVILMFHSFYPNNFSKSEQPVSASSTGSGQLGLKFSTLPGCLAAWLTFKTTNNSNSVISDSTMAEYQSGCVCMEGSTDTRTFDQILKQKVSDVQEKPRQTLNTNEYQNYTTLLVSLASSS